MHCPAIHRPTEPATTVETRQPQPRPGPPARGGCLLPTAALATLLLAGALSVGCQSPPAVGPLLDVVYQAVASEQDQLEADRQRFAALADQQRAALADAFDADLAAVDQLDRRWVAEAAGAYALARELLARNQVQVDHQMQTRQRNLQLSRRALQRARALLAAHDRLFDMVPDLRRPLEQAIAETASNGDPR